MGNGLNKVYDQRIALFTRGLLYTMFQMLFTKKHVLASGGGGGGRGGAGRGYNLYSFDVRTNCYTNIMEFVYERYNIIHIIINIYKYT